MSYNNQVDFTGSTQSDLDCENAELVSNCCKAYPRVEVNGIEFNDEEAGICSDCGGRCEYVEIETEGGQRMKFDIVIYNRATRQIDSIAGKDMLRADDPKSGFHTVEKRLIAVRERLNSSYWAKAVPAGKYKQNDPLEPA